MTSRVTYAPQDFQKMCEQAERDHESRKVLILLERVKRQIADRGVAAPDVQLPKPPLTAIAGKSGLSQYSARPAPFDR